MNQETIFDFKSKKGMLYHKISYHRYGKAKKTNRERDVEEAIDSNNEPDINEMECLLFFRNCVIDRDIEILKIKLNQTVEMRQRLIKKKETIFNKAFPFYFIRPELVKDLFLSMLYPHVADANESFSYHRFFYSCDIGAVRLRNTQCQCQR